jgi:hypothetical protein
VAVPPPPDPFDPLLETWDAEVPLVRVHPLKYTSTSFNPSASSGRFRPVYRTKRRLVVPTIYAADDVDGALSESVYHDLPVRATPKHVPRSLLVPYGLSRLRVMRSLTLVSLRGHGLRRLGIRHGRLIEVGPSAYTATAAWGQAAYDHAAKPDGLTWISRQFPGGIALMLFGDRCSAALEPFDDEPPLPLAHGRGFELVCIAAAKAGVVIVER